MDNASKALVMVGAILIAVMLISLGVFLFTYARDQAEGQTQVMDSLSASAFNEQFLSYCGTKVKGSTVKSLIGKINSTKGGEHVVEAKTTTSAGSVDATAYYTVKETYDDYGYINTITIAIIKNSGTK